MALVGDLAVHLLSNTPGRLGGCSVEYLAGHEVVRFAQFVEGLIAYSVRIPHMIEVTIHLSAALRRTGPTSWDVSTAWG